MRKLRKLTALLLILLIFISLGSCTFRIPADATQTTTVEVVEQVESTVEVDKPDKTDDVILLGAIHEIETPEPIINDYEATLIAKTLYGEYRGEDKLQQAGVVCCILNRVDHYGKSIESIVTAPYQFHGYDKNHPVLPYLYDTAVDVLTRWYREKDGETDVGRVLPEDYLWFGGNGTINRFRNAYEGEYDIWDWTLPNPYTT